MTYFMSCSFFRLVVSYISSSVLHKIVHNFEPNLHKTNKVLPLRKPVNYISMYQSNACFVKLFE